MNAPEADREGKEATLDAQAADWLVRRDAGFTVSEASEFARWRRQSVQHDAAVTRLETTWRMLQTLQNFRPEALEHPDRDLLQPVRSRKTLAFSMVALAAAIAVLLAFPAVWRATTAPRAIDLVYATGAAGFQRVALADGSILELNATTEVRVDFSGAERHVRLVRGEASFAVAKNKARPFIVAAGPVAVRAVGTAFDVRFAGQGKIDVLVTEGVVQVGQAPLESSAHVAAVEVATLEAGQHALLSADGTAPAQIAKVSPEMTRAAVAWRSPRLVFADTPLADVLLEFNLHNRVKLELGDSELGGRPVAGSFEADNVEAFVRLITGNNDIMAERPTSDRIVLRKVR